MLAGFFYGRRCESDDWRLGGVGVENRLPNKVYTQRCSGHPFHLIAGSKFRSHTQKHVFPVYDRTFEEKERPETSSSRQVISEDSAREKV